MGFAFGWFDMFWSLVLITVFMINRRIVSRTIDLTLTSMQNIILFFQIEALILMAVAVSCQRCLHPPIHFSKSPSATSCLCFATKMSRNQSNSKYFPSSWSRVQFWTNERNSSFQEYLNIRNACEKIDMGSSPPQWNIFIYV